MTDPKRDYFNLQNDWLRQLAGDPLLSAADIATGIVLALHMNRQTRLAWPSIDTIADTTRRSASTPWRCVRNLERRGHISVDYGRGRYTPNRYSFHLKDCDGAEFSKTARPQCFSKFKDCTAAISKTAAVQREPMIEPMRERPPSKQGRKKPIPEGFSLSPKMADFARGKLPGISEAELQNLFERFCDYHRAKGSTFVDWVAAWQNWVRNEVSFRSKRPGASRPTGRPQI